VNDFFKQFRSVIFKNCTGTSVKNKSSSGKKHGPHKAGEIAFYADPHLMAISNINTGEIIDVNESFLNTLGYNKKEIVGKTFDELNLFPDIKGSDKYMKLLPRFKKVGGLQLTLMTKSGERKPFLFYAKAVKLNDDFFLLTTYNPVTQHSDIDLRERTEDILDDIFETVSSYLLRVTVTKDNKFLIREINRKAEDVENVSRLEIKGKTIDNTPLSEKVKLIELLNHIRITGEPIKMAVSTLGNRSQGFYIGFLLSSGDIIVTWEPSESSSYVEKDYFTVSDSANKVVEMAFEIDLHGKLIKTDARSLKHIGFTEEDFKKGIFLSDLFPTGEFKRAMKNLNSIWNENDTKSNEYILKKKDGTWIPILTRTFGVFSDGRLIGYRGVITDITALKNRERQIAKEKAFLEHLIDSTPLAIAITDIPGKITHLNREFTRLFGYTNDEAIGNYINELIVPDELMEEAESIDEQLLTNKKVTVETVRKDKQGNRIYVSLTASGVIMNNVTVATLCIYRDITNERKNKLLHEILYNISRATLDFSEIKDIYQVITNELTKLWDTSNFFIALYNREKHILSLPFFVDEKDSFREIPVKGTITGWIVEHGTPLLLKEGDISKMEEKGEIDLIGSPCKVWLGVPLKAENEIIGAICLQDYHSENKFSYEDLRLLELIANQVAVSIQKRDMLENLIIARQKAEEAAVSKQNFMTTLSHEIRTPLNEVIGISNLLMQSSQNDEQLELIKTLHFSANHLLTLVNDVLDYSKMESGKIVFEQIDFNFNDFLDEIKRSYFFKAQEKNLEFLVIKGSNVPDEVNGDPLRLNQILSNLLSNAFKFTNKGSIKIFVDEIKRTENTSTLEFRVKDTGIGIPADKQKFLFESFTQASPDISRRFGGTGLGLAICKKLVELQGGKIYVESEPEKGSTFIFTITLGLPEQKGKTKDKGEFSFKGLEGKKILVAEDNKINFFVLNKFLTGWGVNVTHAEDGKQAIEKIEEEEFDLILMDLHMPVIDGIEATRIIRSSEDPRIKTVPIIAITAAIMSETNDQIEGLNINDYILKPFRPQDLFEKIKNNLK